MFQKCKCFIANFRNLFLKIVVYKWQSYFQLLTTLTSDIT